MTDETARSHQLSEWRLSGWGLQVAEDASGAIVLRGLDDGACGAIEQSIEAAPWRGLRVRFSAALSAKDVGGSAGLVLRVMGHDDVTVALADTFGREPSQPAGPIPTDIVVDVAPDADKLVLGVELCGPGTVSASNLSLDETTDAPTARQLAEPPDVPDTPAGRQLWWLLSVIGARGAGLTPGDAHGRFAESAMRRGFPDLVARLRSLALELHPLTVVNVASRRPTRARLTVRNALGAERVLAVAVEAVEPHRIVWFQSSGGTAGGRRRPQLSKRGRSQRNKLIRSLVRDAARGLLKPFRRRSAAGIVVGAADRRAEIAALTTRIGVRVGTANLRTRGAGAQRREDAMEAVAERSAQDLFRVMGSMKGAMMKVAQFASYTVDGLPPTIEQELSKLQQAAPPMDYELVSKVISSELGGRPEEVFSAFDREPMAAASVGQVHRATTRDGLDVAVKVQYPGVEKAILADLENAEMMLTSVAGMFDAGTDPGPILREITERATDELDYGLEASNQRRFLELYRGHALVKVPEVVDALSTTRVLTTELVRGRRFYDVLADAQDARNRFGEIVYRFATRSVFVDGIFSGDPHPGNYVFMDDGRVCFLDFGMVKRVESASEHALLRTPVRALLTGDESLVTDELRRELVGGAADGQAADAAPVLRLFSALFGRALSDMPIRITRAGLQDALQRTTSDGQSPGQRLGFAPALGVFVRYMFGTHAVLAHLEAEANWHRVLREVILGEPPSTEIGLAWSVTGPAPHSSTSSA